MTERQASDLRDEARAALQAVRESRGFHLFTTQDRLSTDGSVQWRGGVQDFLKFASEAGVKTLYLSEWEDAHEPEGAIGDVEIGFVMDGLMHVYSTVPLVPESEEEGENVDGSDFLAQHRVEIVSALVEQIRLKPGEGFSDKNLAADLLRRYLKGRLGVEELPSPPRARPGHQPLRGGTGVPPSGFLQKLRLSTLSPGS